MVIQLLKGIPKLAKKGWKKAKGTPERKAKADALREHRSSKSHKAYKKLMKKIDHEDTRISNLIKELSK